MIFNIEKFYLKINKHIKLVQSFTEINEMESIIKMCRLKPYKYNYSK